MDYQNFLKYGTTKLSEQDIPSSYLDCLILLEQVTGEDRSAILAHPKRLINAKDKNVLDRFLQMRSQHIPIAHIVQRAYFYDRQFIVNDKVLVPRPESETMIDNLKAIVASDFPGRRSHKSTEKVGQILAADVGTGCGAIGITAMLEVNNLACDLIDIDGQTLEVARSNVVLHTISTNVLQSDLLSGNDNSYDILLCNLPYIPDDFNINLSATHEPKHAIFGGKDGLDLYRKLFKDVSKKQQAPLYILCESLPTSQLALRKVAAKYGYSLVKTDDFISIFKASAAHS